MQVKELLLEALARANHCQRGFGAEAGEITMAEKQFNAQLRKYSDQNMITAYQKVFDFIPTSTSVVVGAPSYKKGVKVAEYEVLPSASSVHERFVDGRDYAYGKLNSTDIAKKYYKINTDTSEQTPSYSWSEVSTDTICEWFPDFKLNDMERVMSVMKKDYTGRWCKMNFCPLTEFFCTGDKELYNTANAGENKVRFTFKNEVVNKEIKVVYNSSMKFGKNEYLELPEAHIELLTLATTCAILMEDCDADQSQLNNYKMALKELEDQIIASTAVTRRIIREESQVKFSNRLDYLASNCWL